MADLRYHFENEIKLKISQKSKSNLSDETALAKYFRYFDLNSSGTVSAEEFQKTLIKIGITSVDNEGMFRLFDYYDVNRNGELDYREFAAAIYQGNPPPPQHSQRSSPDRPTTSQLRGQENQIDEILANLKRQLRSQGVGGMIGLAKALRLADKYQDKKLEFNEFSDVLRDCHIDLTNRQIERIFASLNKSGTDLISYEDFLAALKGRLSTNKKSVITQAFHRLDNDRDGHVNIEEIRNYYNVQHHPDVTRGNRSENEVYREFNNAFDSYLAYKRVRNVSLSSDEFEDLFAFIGSSYEDEHHFCTIMNQVWGLNKPQEYSDYKPWAQRTPAQPHRNDEIKRTENFAPPIEELEEHLTLIFNRFRSRMTFKGVRGYLGIFKLFKNVDYDDDGIISNKEFLKILRDFKMEIPEQDLMYVFAHFDSRKQGQISYEDFMLNVLGSLNYERKHIADQAWRKLDIGMSGRVQLSNVKGMFKDLRNHPDVKSGRKYQEQVILDLNDLLEFHHNIIERAQSSFVSKNEFDNFLLYISANTEDDKYFEAIIQSIFKLETERNYQDSYAGQAAGRKGYDPTKGYLNDFHRSSQHGGSVSQNAPFGTDNGRPTSQSSFRDDDRSSFRDDRSERSEISTRSSQYSTPQYTSQQQHYTPQYTSHQQYTSQYNNPPPQQQYTSQYNNAPSSRSQYNQPYTSSYGQSNYGGTQTQSYTPQQQTPPKKDPYSNPYTTQYSRQNNPPAPTSEIPSQRTSFSDKEFQKEREPSSGVSELEEIKKKIRGRGIRGILGVIKSLRLLDNDKLKTLPVKSFVKVLNDFRLDVDENKFKTTLELNDLVKQGGRVDYDAFLNLIKGDLNQKRKNAIQDAYERINEEKKGYVTTDDIKTIYDARGHPDVKGHKREEDDVSMEFLETFDLQHMLSNKGKDKRVTLDEFVSYYEIVNCVIDDDKQFETMLTNCFRVYPSASKSDVSETSSRPQTKGFGGNSK